MKSDPLSWTANEQKEIDRALEPARRPSVHRARTLLPGTEFTIHQAICRKTDERHRRQREFCVIRHPTVLYDGSQVAKDSSRSYEEGTKL